MKLLNFKLSVLSILFCFCVNNTFSQEKNLFFKEGLWVKNHTTNNIPISMSEDELKKYFNFNEVVDFSDKNIQQFNKNLITKQSSLFVAIKSDKSEGNALISLERGSFKANITNQKIISDKEVLLTKGDFKTGVLLSYVYSKKSLIGRKNGVLSFDDLLFKNDDFKNQLLELIYIPRAVSGKEKGIIESYLSLKYGISLNEGKDYYNSNGEKIWNIKDNRGYNQRITGIGKDQHTVLNQKQSKNSLEDGLCIGLEKIKNSNNQNEGILINKDFMLWGDNDQSVLLEKNNESNQKRMKRIWKMNLHSDGYNSSHKTQIIIDKSKMKLENQFTPNDSDYMWLAVDSLSDYDFNYSNARYIKATLNDEKRIIFDDVKWNSNGHYLFTIVKAPEQNATSALINSKVAIDNNNKNTYSIYPNPLNSNENFAVEFNLKTLSKVSISITDINGKILKTKELGFVDKYIWYDSLLASGTYMVIVTIDGVVEANKLIVK